jgi:hypothetical protein
MKTELSKNAHRRIIVDSAPSVKGRAEQFVFHSNLYALFRILKIQIQSARTVGMWNRSAEREIATLVPGQTAAAPIQNRGSYDGDKRWRDCGKTRP